MKIDDPRHDLKPAALRERLSMRRTPTTAMELVISFSKSNGEIARLRFFESQCFHFISFVK
jgi:hypothetical protein